MSACKTFSLGAIKGYGTGCECVQNQLVRGYALSTMEYDDAAYPYEMPQSVYYSRAQQKLYMAVTSGTAIMDFPEDGIPTDGNIRDFRYLPLFDSVYYQGKMYACFADGRQFVLLNGATVLKLPQRCFFEIKTMCVHHGRVFVSDGEYRIAWSGMSGVDTWASEIDESGYVILPYQEQGKILRLFSFGDDVLVLRTGGITLLTAFGSPENFKFRAVTTSICGVEPNSIAYAQPYLYFKSATGFWCYQGALKRVDMGIYAFESIKSATARQGEYFVSGRVNGAKCVVCYRAPTGQAHQIADIEPMLFCAADVYGVDGNDIYRLRTAPLMTWETAETDFGTTGRKIVKSVLFPTGFHGELTLYADGVKRTLPVCYGRQYVAMSGNRFALEVRGKSKIGDVLVEVAYGD